MKLSLDIKFLITEQHKNQSIHDIPVRLDKLGILDHNFKGKMDENNRKRKTHWKTLEASQLASRIEHEQMKANIVALLEKSKPGGPTAISGNLSLDDSEVKEGKMQQKCFCID